LDELIEELEDAMDRSEEENHEYLRMHSERRRAEYVWNAELSPKAC
jgi:hypothetical protein